MAKVYPTVERHIQMCVASTSLAYAFALGHGRTGLLVARTEIDVPTVFRTEGGLFTEFVYDVDGEGVASGTVVELRLVEVIHPAVVGSRAG